MVLRFRLQVLNRNPALLASSCVTSEPIKVPTAAAPTAATTPIADETMIIAATVVVTVEII